MYSLTGCEIKESEKHTRTTIIRCLVLETLPFKAFQYNYADIKISPQRKYDSDQRFCHEICGGGHIFNSYQIYFEQFHSFWKIFLCKPDGLSSTLIQ